MPAGCRRYSEQAHFLRHQRGKFTLLLHGGFQLGLLFLCDREVCRLLFQVFCQMQHGSNFIVVNYLYCNLIICF